MAENEMTKMSDEENEKVSGGGLFNRYTHESYNEAGVQVNGAGIFTNDGYTLMASGENLTEGQVNDAVRFYREVGRPANKFEEIIDRFYPEG